MAGLVRESHELVLDARAIPWPDSFDFSAIHGRLVKIGPDNPCCFCRGMGHPARDLIRARDPSEAGFAGLFHVEQILGIAGVVERKECGLRVTFLLTHPAKIYASAKD